MDVTGLIPNHSHTAYFWIRTATDGTLMSIDTHDFTEPGSEDWLVFGVVESKLNLVYTHGTEELINLAGYTNIADNDWHIVAWCLEM
jgi:hypothetical protein